MIDESEHSATPQEAVNYLVERVEDFANTALASPNFAEDERGQLRTSLSLFRRSLKRLNSQFAKNHDSNSFEEAAYYMNMKYLIRSAFFIGSSATISDTSQLFAERAQAAEARAGRDKKSEATLAAVRVVMKPGATKPTLGKAYAKYIQPPVEEELGRKVSVSTIKRCVGVIIKERTRKAC
jgi:hypothetical protein